MSGSGDRQSDQVLFRYKKLESLREQGIEPYGEKYAVTHSSAEIVEGFDDLEGETVSISGRIMTRRGHGKAGLPTSRTGQEECRYMSGRTGSVRKIISCIRIWILGISLV